MWLRRKVSQRSCDPGAGGRRGMYLDTDASEMSKPSFFNSPWILGAPQAFSRAISRMSLRTSAFSGGRPGPPVLSGYFGPVPAETSAVPVHDGVGFHDHEPVLPPGPGSPQSYPESAVQLEQKRLRPRLFQRRDLLTQGQVFDHEIGPRTAGCADAADDDRDQEHDGTIHGGEDRTNLGRIASWLASMRRESAFGGRTVSRLFYGLTKF